MAVRTESEIWALFEGGLRTRRDSLALDLVNTCGFQRDVLGSARIVSELLNWESEAKMQMRRTRAELMYQLSARPDALPSGERGRLSRSWANLNTMPWFHSGGEKNTGYCEIRAEALPDLPREAFSTDWNAFLYGRLRKIQPLVTGEPLKQRGEEYRIVAEAILSRTQGGNTYSLDRKTLLLSRLMARGGEWTARGELREWLEEREGEPETPEDVSLYNNQVYRISNEIRDTFGLEETHVGNSTDVERMRLKQRVELSPDAAIQKVVLSNDDLLLGVALFLIKQNGLPDKRMNDPELVNMVHVLLSKKGRPAEARDFMEMGERKRIEAYNHLEQMFGSALNTEITEVGTPRKQVNLQPSYIARLQFSQEELSEIVAYSCIWKARELSQLPYDVSNTAPKKLVFRFNSPRIQIGIGAPLPFYASLPGARKLLPSGMMTIA